MRFNPKAGLDDSRIGDAGGGGGFGGGPMGGPMRIPIPGGGRAGGGMGLLIIIVLMVVLSMCNGGGIPGLPSDPGQQAPQSGPQQGGTDSSRMGDSERYANCKYGEDANNDPDCARMAYENSMYDYWSTTITKGFQPARVMTFSGATSTGCGTASSQVGPFYCPTDNTIWLDSTFFKDIYEGQLGGQDGPAVEPYVLGHEYGHHIQNLLGIMGKVRTQKGPNSDAVKLELQADCFAGTWMADADGTKSSGGEPLFAEPFNKSDIQQAIDAAATVGDDRIQKKTQGRVDPDGWTHGSAEQRMQSFETGYDSGDPESCLAIGPQ